MKKTILILIIAFFTISFVKGQNPLDTVTWPKVKWEKTPGTSCEINLTNVLNHHINEAKQDSNLKFLELHFSSIKTLIKEFPSCTDYSKKCKLLDTYRNYNDGGSLDKYRQGAKQLLLAYETTPGVISYVAVCLPENYDPRIAYPLYIWGTEGNQSIIDVNYKLDEQITGGLLWRAPSSRFKDGYSIVPYGLREYGSTDESLADIMKAIDYFAQNFKTDKSKYYMGGFSNGAAATFYLSTNKEAMEKYKFAGLAFYALSVKDSELSRDLSSLKDVPIWLSIGVEDYYFDGIKSLFDDKLTEIGNPPKYDYPYYTGHVWTQDIQGDMCRFFQGQQRIMPGEAPAQPTKLNESGATKKQVKIEWTDNADNELLFVVERKAEKDTSFAEVAKVAHEDAFYIDSAVIQGNTYTYRVSAYNESGQSAPSNELSLTVPGVKLTNLALSKTVTDSNGSEPANVGKLVDGHILPVDRYRWNASPIPQWAEIDLGAAYYISMFKLYPYDNREYLYSIEVKEDGAEEYEKVVDKHFIISSPVYTDEVAVKARYVRLKINGALIYAENKVNIGELEVYGRADDSAIIEAHNETNIQSVLKTDQVLVYPNPITGDELMIKAIQGKVYGVQIITLDGRVVKTDKNHSSQIKIDVRTMQSGVYILKILKETGMENMKILIE